MCGHSIWLNKVNVGFINCWVSHGVMVAMLVGRYKRILYYMLLYLPTKMAAVSNCPPRLRGLIETQQLVHV